MPRTLLLALVSAVAFSAALALPRRQTRGSEVSPGGPHNGQSTAGKVAMVVAKDSLYVPVSIGTPASTAIAMSVDTGSPLTWVTRRHYSPRDSITAHETEQHYNFSYLDSSSAVGRIFTDTVHCSGLSTPVQPFGYGTYSDRGIETIEGLLGLGLPTEVNGCDGCKDSTLVRNMVERKVIPRDLIAVDAASDHPALYFGSHPPHSKGRQTHFVDVVTDQGSWDVPSSSINGFDTGRMTIDSGAGLIFTSVPGLKHICHSVSGFVWNTGDDGYLSCNVTSASTKRLKPLHLRIGKGFRVTLRPKDVYDGNNLLLFALPDSDDETGGTGILGLPLFRNAYISFYGSQTPHPRLGFTAHRD